MPACLEPIEFTREGASRVIPAWDCILLVEIKATAGPETAFIFCDYGITSGRSLQLFNSRVKAFLCEATVFCDYAVKIGTMTLPAERVAGIFQLLMPPWYQRVEADALALAQRAQKLAAEIGLAGCFASGNK